MRSSHESGRRGTRLARVVAAAVLSGCTAAGATGVQTSTALPDDVPTVTAARTPSLIENAAVAEAPAARRASRSTPPVVVYGRAGTFGGLADDQAVPVPGWSFLPGQAAYFTAVDAEGRVLVANEPQTDNQTVATGTAMALSEFDPASMTLRTIELPTDAGRTQVAGRTANGAGGADVADLLVVGTGTGQRLVLSSTAPYQGWDPSTEGVFPTIAVLGPTDAGWQLQAGYTASALRASSAAGATACGRSLPTPAGPLADCGGFAELGLLPASGLVVATRYFGHPEAGATNGGITVFALDGTVVADLEYPQVTADGASLQVRPREIDVDPTSTIGDERFLVVFDVFGPNGERVPFTAQEFRFDARNRQLSAVTAPFVTGSVAADGERLGIETALYDRNGDLWIAEARSRSLEGGRLVRFDAGAGRSRLERSCAAVPNRPSANWAAACAPDHRYDATLGHSLVRSLTEDPGRNRVVAVTIDGAVVTADDAGSQVAATLPLGALVDRSVVPIGPRKGAVDVARDVLWIPVQQILPSGACTATPCTPGALDQWLVRVDLTAV